MPGSLLPGALDAVQVAALTGFSVDSIYEHAGDVEDGWSVLRAGRRLRFPTRPLLRVLGLTEVAAARLLGIDAEADPAPRGVGGRGADHHQRQRPGGASSLERRAAP